MARQPDPPEPSTRLPLLLAVDDDDNARRRIRTELDRRYGHDYYVICADSAQSALETLERVRAKGGEVALVLAEQWMAETTGAGLLAQGGGMHPTPRRGPLSGGGPWGDPGARGAPV